ncbi:CaiB/BaiF CoA-transferase family protein [Hyphomonas sp. ND6WE1B]|uniref:CaiB/BaiF CoA transferase family protein n=1 Tax=Hyphomonas sp. ND6WE1B TaxID=1848191 RepID=UPI0008076664|nr:CoA transferase [Hyphomonas sp. ND6WE1B]
MKRLPLEGLLVVSLEQAVAAPLASSRLADAGARVIKLERPEGDFARGYDTYAAGHSSYFAWLNRRKQSCRVDLRDDADRALVHEMLSRADVFIQNLGPGAAERLGLGADALRSAHPRLITCGIRGYAEGTPDATRKAYDLMIQAESGLSGVTGTEASGPSRIGVSICDITTGMTAHAQILEALVVRERTGKGSNISVSLFDVAAEIMNIPYIAARNGGPFAKRVGLAHPSIAPYGAYDCLDGSILISVQSEREWAKLCAGLLGDPSLATDQRFCSNSLRVENRPELEEIVSRAFSTLTRQEAVERLDAARIAWGRVSDLNDLMNHDAVTTSIATADVDEIHMIAGPAVVNGVRTGGGRVPALGEHDELVRQEFCQPATG